MIEIFKGLINLLGDFINSFFNIPIQLYDDKSVPLGFLMIGVGILAVSLACLFSFLNIGGDDE